MISRTKRLLGPVRQAIKLGAASVPVEAFQRLMTYSILRNHFGEIAALPEHRSREELWNDAIGIIGPERKITYVEFGVHQGHSIRYFAGHNRHPESEFIGLDSFEGLPEAWGPLGKGTFDTGGALPSVDDRRVSFIKGWFQNTWPELHRRLLQSTADTLVVHYDADLYSSTLFALSMMDSLKRSYLALFDEFTGHETRALFNYCQAFNAEVSFIGKTTFESAPNQLVCRIVPGGAGAAAPVA
jgi:hypothetical protein